MKKQQQQQQKKRRAKMAANTTLLLSLSLLLLLLPFSSFSLAEDADCVYTFYIRTGSIIKGGTDSIISARLYDANGYWFGIRNLEAWGGLMERGHNYYERGNLDIFSGTAPCLTTPICALNLTSDGSGAHHGWYCNYVEVTFTGVHAQCSQRQFEIEQWLALDTSPFRLTAIRNSCPYDIPEDKAGGGFLGERTGKKSALTSSSSFASAI